MSMNLFMWPCGTTYDADWVEGAVCHALIPLLFQLVLPWVGFQKATCWDYPNITVSVV